MRVLEIALCGAFRINDVIIRTRSERLVICRAYIGSHQAIFL